jgi:probable rRNA maturation factor
MIVFELKGRVPSVLASKMIRRTAREVSHVLSSRLKGKKRSVAVVFVSPQSMRSYHKAYRGKSTVTDVLSFSSEKGSVSFPIPAASNEIPEQGDLLICPSYARGEATTRHVPYAEELIRLLVHGTLHLFGYDHERVRDEHRMFAIQEAVVQRVIRGKKKMRV